MKYLKAIADRRPVRILAALQAVIALAMGFGWNLTGAQVGLITAAAAAVLGALSESQVTPVSDPRLPVAGDPSVQAVY